MGISGAAAEPLLCGVSLKRGAGKKGKEERGENRCAQWPHSYFNSVGSRELSAVLSPPDTPTLQRGRLDEATHIWPPREPGDLESIAGLF